MSRPIIPVSASLLFRCCLFQVRVKGRLCSRWRKERSTCIHSLSSFHCSRLCAFINPHNKTNIQPRLPIKGRAGVNLSDKISLKSFTEITPFLKCARFHLSLYVWMCMKTIGRMKSYLSTTIPVRHPACTAIKLRIPLDMWLVTLTERGVRLYLLLVLYDADADPSLLPSLPYPMPSIVINRQ